MAIVSDEQVIKVLRQYNPWWRNPLAIKEENKPQKRLAYYEALRMISHKTIRRFAVLSGARRVGKTTIMYQMMNSLIDEGVNPKNILYVSFDNPIVKLVNVETVLSIYESLYPIEGTRYIFLDEIQYTEHWELWMKVIYDSRKDIRLTATGSASPILEKGSTDSGTGRWSILKIPTMSFYEYCRLLQIEEPILPDNLRLTRLVKMSKAELGDLMDRFAPLEGHFNRYLMIGGFPELVLSDDDVYAQRMLREDVVDKVIKRDVLTLFNTARRATLRNSGKNMRKKFCSTRLLRMPLMRWASRSCPRSKSCRRSTRNCWKKRKRPMPSTGVPVRKCGSF